MRLLSKFGVIFFLAVFNKNCKEVELSSKEYPFIQIEKIDDISKSGVTLKATLSDFRIEEVEKTGFTLFLNADDNIRNGREIEVPVIGNSIEKKIQNDLINDTVYYVRAFVKTNSHFVYSAMEKFISQGGLGPQIEKFHPIASTPGNIITIIGSNFSEKKSSNLVEVGNELVSIVSVSSDSISFQSPNVASDLLENISVTVAEKTVISGSKIEVLYPWKDLGDYPGGDITRKASFTIGSKGFVSLGARFSTLATSNLWEFDNNTNIWTEKSPFPGDLRARPLAFSLDNLGYIGLGGHLGVHFFDLWEYDPKIDRWNEKANFPGSLSGVPLISYFTLNNKLFLFVQDFLDNSAEFWNYEASIDTWTQIDIGDFFSTKRISGAFSLSGNGHLLEIRDLETVIWEYDIDKNEFLLFDILPWGQVLLNSAFTFNENVFIQQNDETIIQYDPENKLTFAHKPPPNFSFDIFLEFESNFVFNGFGGSIISYEPW